MSRYLDDLAEAERIAEESAFAYAEAPHIWDEDPAVVAEFAPTRVLDGDLLLCGRRAAVDHHGYLWLEETYGLGLEVQAR